MKIIRTSTIPMSIDIFCNGLLKELQNEHKYEVVVVSSPGKELKHIEERENVRCIAVPMQRRISPFRDIFSLVKLIHVFLKEKPSMVHSITPKAGLLCMIAAWICRVPVRLHTFTGLVFPNETGLKQKLLILTDRITCHCATHIVPEGEGVKNDLISYKITKKPLKVLGYGNIKGINLNLFDPELPEIKLKAATIRVNGLFTYIYIGRLVRDKGINELIEAFKNLNLQYPKTRLVLVGDLEQNLDPIDESTLDIIRNNKAIEAVGRQDDVRPWLAASDAFVFPSYREGFPNVVIEACAMGLPSIVTDINGSREIISDDYNGIIVPSRKTEILRQAMEILFTDNARRQRLASKARSSVAHRYEQSFVRKCLIDYYHEIINETI